MLNLIAWSMEGKIWWSILPLEPYSCMKQRRYETDILKYVIRNENYREFAQNISR